MKYIMVLMLVVTGISLMGCGEEVVWNEKLNRCQQVNEPYQIVASERCGK